MPRLPRRSGAVCHTCHVKSRWMSPSATPATQKWRGVTGVTAAPKPVQARHPAPSVPRLPRKTTVDVRLCHTCHVKSTSPSATSATPATQNAAVSVCVGVWVYGCVGVWVWGCGGVGVCVCGCVVVLLCVCVKFVCVC